MPVILLLISIILFSPIGAIAGCRYYTPSESYTAPATSGATYYVDGVNGSDSYDGTSVTHSSGAVGPWKTLSKAFNRYETRGAGTRILIKSGTYREQIVIPNTWSYGTNDASRLIVAAYGDGEVVIDGSINNDLGGWTVYSGTIWKATFTTAHSALHSVAAGMDFLPYHQKWSLGNVIANGDWFYDSATKTLYLQTSTNPNNTSWAITENVGDDSSSYGIYVNNGGQSYVTISGLTIRNWPSHGVFVESSNNYVTIDRCLIYGNAKSGIWYASDSNGWRITKNYVYGNVTRNWPRGRWDTSCYNSGGWPSAISAKGGYGLISGNVVAWNGGEGIIFGNFPGYHTVQDNIVHDNWSMQIYPATTTNPLIQRNITYSSGPHDAYAITNDNKPAGFATCSANNLANIHLRMRGDGIATADEGDAIAPYYSGGQIYNNIIIYAKTGLAHYADNSNSGLKSTKIYNNTIITPFDEVGSDYEWRGMNYSNLYGLNSNSSITNNLIFVQGNSKALRYLASGETDSGVTFSHNLYFNPSAGSDFLYKDQYYSFSGWAGLGVDVGSAYTNPLLAVTTWNSYFTPVTDHGTCWGPVDYIGVDIANLEPQSNSPTRGMGADLSSYFTTDYNSYSRVTPSMTIGALEYGSVDSGSAINGVCGPSNGLSLSSAPVTGLCSAGTASAVSGTGPWSWTCAGSGGGSTASCSASATSPTARINGHINGSLK